jgi:hypothetical protein
MKPSDDLDRASELVYEAVTGKCWHKPDKHDEICVKCKYVNLDTGVSNDNPAIDYSLDMWQKYIWPVMTDAQRVLHDDALTGKFSDLTRGLYRWEHPPLHHLEAALRALNLYDTWRESNV